MKGLSIEQVLKVKETHDPDSIKELSLSHRALSDVSCLGKFKNLERLDLQFNSLTSLEGLKSCVNLKWLSVVQNKLQSLKGIEGLSKLTVLNAGKNKLKSMDEVRFLLGLRALILNDNEISSICKLDPLKDLNTLVLSRNPISKIGESLVKMENLSKISLSNCQIQNIASSLKSCTELRELRLAHNEIKSLPADLAFNKKLQNLDLGNNVISKWSDVKVLDTLISLRNLNLQGNPIAENEKLVKKVRKSLPALHIFNAKPIDKSTRVEKIDRLDGGDREQMDHKGKKRSKHDTTSQIIDENLSTGNDSGVERERNQKRKKKSEKAAVAYEEDKEAVKKKQKRTKLKEQLGELDVIDDGETSFLELFAGDASENYENDGEKIRVSTAVQDKNFLGAKVVYPNKKNKGNKNPNKGWALEFPPEAEIGMGGPSTWGD